MLDMPGEKLADARSRALCIVVLISGCVAGPTGPGKPPDAGPRTDVVVSRDLGPGVDGDGPVVSPDAAAGIPLEQLGVAIKQAKCEGLVACALASDQARCLSAVTSWPGLEQLRADVAAGRVAFDPLQAAACVELYRGRGCPVLWFDAAARAAGCQQAFRGLVAIGEACYRDGACASGRCGDRSCGPDGCCGGRCVERPLVPLGEDCSAGRCAEDAICFEQVLGPPLCDTRSVAGEDCWDHADCVDGLYCVGVAPRSFPGTCRAPAPSGSTCDRTLGVTACARLDEWCDPASGKCQPRVALGGSCDPAQLSCVGLARCDKSGKCVPLAGRDEPCDVLYAVCIGELLCGGTCQLPEDPRVCP
jgi:hypothetical protein